MKHNLFHARKLAIVLCLATLFCAWGNSMTIWVKAYVAQYLIQDAWQKTLQTQSNITPWPWADTWPVARLKNKHLSKDLFVLTGTNGTSLAFGPGHMDGSAMPNHSGTTVIAGHKDTHFNFLENVQLGERLYLQGKDGHWKTYEAVAANVVNSHKESLLLSNANDELLLITCYPFNSTVTRGPLRYVVKAKPIELNTEEVIVLHSTADKMVSINDFASLADQLESEGIEREMSTYSGAPHAFSVIGSSRYHEQADKKSWQRLNNYLKETF